ncbi:methionyl-tRNA formyltransferase [soil metagenome]
MSALRIAFAGTPTFALPTLEALLQSPHNVVAVYTQPDRPAGRGRELTASPVKQLAMAHATPVHQPPSLKDPREQGLLQDLNLDLMVVIAYGLLLPLPILNAPRLGCINVHASLLPRWRGAAPIQRALLAGDHNTGITIMQMDAGLDTGGMLLQQSCPILPTYTSETLQLRLAQLGATTLLSALESLQTTGLVAIPQDETHASYAAKLTKQEGKIDWQRSAGEIERAIRAYNPWPIAYTHIEGQTLRIWQAQIASGQTGETPGKIINIGKEGVEVATGLGVLQLQIVQFPGGRPLPVNEVLHAKNCPIKIGASFNDL